MLKSGDFSFPLVMKKVCKKHTSVFHFVNFVYKDCDYFVEFSADWSLPNNSKAEKEEAKHEEEGMHEL